ncbi:MAG: acetyl-CoA carboxylase carboxyl transferase subunit alpha [Candidatus Marinimicrobia bacterium]|jgi:acetyl-CoA carboxylase carboxyl transferase subunit alpha|nr:acetyl-CoA carboxylase carboxyl transferase subunit alpha [Candidatus Neomarinimicrobiota bacterium]|tara:strand:- start:168 stop:1127 length:960 start_codon:yes stop_codon:yes gene_type:complete
MAKHYLDFEKPIQEFEEKIIKLQSLDNDSANVLELERLINRRDKKIDEIYGNLNRWQRVQLARHPERPYSLDYVGGIVDEFVELHGDRAYADDKAIIGGIGKINERSVLFIGQQKGRNTKDNLYRNFGMMRPEGYRKALRLMHLADKFSLPIISLIDTPGAYPGLGAEERGQGEAIAKNLIEMAKLNVPILAIVIGEGASGGALGIGLCDRLIMLENTWYSVISPEGCASILWHDAMKASDAADAMKVTPEDLKDIGICDRIIEEPTGGAHREPEKMYEILKTVIQEEIELIEKENSSNNYLQSRIDRYDKMGFFQEQE